jgi:hypothetical protein
MYAMQFIFKPALLSSESEAEFKALCAEISKEIPPKGIVERIYTHRFAVITWEICRYTLHKTCIIQNKFPEALQSILIQLLHRDHYLYPLGTPLDPILDIAKNYFSDPTAKVKILEILRRFGLDDKAIAAEASRLVLAEVEKYDKMISNAERQRHKTLKQLAQIRKDLAPLFREVTDRIIARAGQPVVDDGEQKAN